MTRRLPLPGSIYIALRWITRCPLCVIMVVLHLQLVPLRKAVVYEVEASETIGNIKAKIEKEEKIPSVLQELTYGTCDLEDQCTVQDYNMHELTEEI